MHLRRQQHPVLPAAVLVCLLVAILSSCSLWNTQKSDEGALRQAVDRFNANLRWEDYKAAAARMVPSGRENFWEQVEWLQGQVRIMDYQVVDVRMNGAEGSGTVTLRYRFFHKRNPQVQTTMLHQKWIYSEKDGSWQVVKNDLEKLVP